MFNPLPRKQVPAPRQHGYLVEAPRAEKGAALDARTKGARSTKEAVGSSAKPSLDDFGGRSDALGG